MNKLLKNIAAFSFALFVAGLINAPVAQAVSDMAVNFIPNPLFGSVNFMPGETTKAQIQVANYSGATQSITIEAINIIDPDHFGDALNLEIREGETTLINKTLTDFFGQGKAYLSNLINGATTTYDLIVTFDAKSSNTYQNKTLKNFDIQIGVQGQTNPIIPSGSGGGSVITPGLIIFNEASIVGGPGSTTLTWQTNYFSTSRVIYSAESEPHDFNYESAPNYGYAHSTVEDSTKVTGHTVVLTGLMPDTLYYYRVISHASPDTVGLSYTFRTPKLAENEEEPVIIEGGKIVRVIRADEGNESVKVAVVASEEAINSVSTTEATGQVLGAEAASGKVAGALDICKKLPNLLWIIFTLIYILMLAINYADKIKKDIREKYGRQLNWLFASLPILVSALAMIFCGAWAWWLWITMAVFYLIVLVVYFLHSDSPIYWRVNLISTLFMAAIVWIVRSCICL